MRGLLALGLVAVLIALVFRTPTGTHATAAVASAKTLAIAVVAFYFGLHKATPNRATGGITGEHRTHTVPHNPAPMEGQGGREPNA